MLIGVCVLLLFSGFFFYNLFRGNSASGAEAEKMSKNISYVAKLQQADIEEVEADIEDMEYSYPTGGAGSGADPRVRYMKWMAKAIVIGDSLTEGLSVYGWLPEGQVYSEIGASLAISDKLFAKAAAAKPKYAFFAFGMNDMGNYAGDSKKFIMKYSEVIDSFKRKSPKSEIFICSISVPTKDAIAGNSSIGHYKEFNAAIEKMCKNKKLTYIDSTYILLKHPELYAGDGIHVSTDYYKYWLDNMIRKAKIRKN